MLELRERRLTHRGNYCAIDATIQNREHRRMLMYRGWINKLIYFRWLLAGVGAAAGRRRSDKSAPLLLLSTDADATSVLNFSASAEVAWARLVSASAPPWLVLPCVWLEDSVGWVGSIPCFRNGSNPFFVWMKKYQKIGSNPILCLVEEIEKRDGGPCSRRWLLHLLAPAGPTYQWHRSSFFLLRPSSSSIHHQSRAALLRRPTLLK